VDTVSRNGNFVLNISPKSDGTIPQDQQEELLEIGRWLDVNGEAIYGTHNWSSFGEGGERGSGTPMIRFTVKGENLYAILVGNWPGGAVIIKTLSLGKMPEGKIESITLLGSDGEAQFSQGDDGLSVTLPATPPCKYAYTLKITGLKMNAPTTTPSGNPQ
jgi:alpha-L-fucosidase